MGEHYGKVYSSLFLEGGTWEPLRPLTLKRTDAVVDLRFHVPEPPLVLDTTRVSDPGHFGFEYTDDSGNPPAIQSVRIVDEDTVRITLSSVPLATARKSVRYAYTGTAGQGGGPQTGARGNLRDSDPTPSMHGNRLFNWAVHFDEPVK